ncbi:piggyBac transposable element-derived protein 4-like [Argopecten irradians]|uniref:piggyBac transposable element-derived protein 4-like n=1 Tax=Argopecten irradians TaxID=31199 RepID=UPI00371E58C0
MATADELPHTQNVMDDMINSDKVKVEVFSGDNDSGDDDRESDIEIPDIYNSDAEESGGESDDEPAMIFNDDDWYSDLHNVIVRPFMQPTGPVLPENFDTETATAKDYFDLVFKPEIMPKIVESTNGYAEWRSRQNDRQDQAWYEITENELNAYLGINIFMGINQLPFYKDYWSKDQFIGNEGIKSVMTVNRYEKVTKYFHVNDRNHEDVNDKLNKVRPVIDMANESFKSSYKPSKNVSVDETMIKWTGRLSHKQYLPAKPIKRGIKVWMQCDADTAYLNEFDILSW